MRRIVKGIYQVGTTAFALVLLTLGWLRWLFCRDPYVVVFGYHSIGDGDLHIAMPTKDFQRQMAWLRRCAIPVLTLSQLESFLMGSPVVRKVGVVVTFDDGFRDNCETAHPILRQNNLRGVFFIATQYVGTHYTWDAGIQGERYPIMDWSEVCRMTAEGEEIESHSVSHPRLGQLSPEATAAELGESAAILEAKTGTRPVAVAYPYGDVGDTEQLTRLVDAAGYRLGFTTRGAVVRPAQPRLMIPRYMVDNFSGRDSFTTHILFLTCIYGTFQWYERLALPVRRRRKSRVTLTA